MVPGGNIPQFPLLPVERDLCDILNITEAEYREFSEELKKNSYARPAAYDHIPDVQAAPALVPILVNLAIGIALVGISMLLAPKPPAQEDQDDIQQKKIADVRGRSRFNQSTGFSSVQQPALIGDPVPILFGRYRGDLNPATGGISTAPTLLWSRLLSYGTHQTFRAIYMVGHKLFNDLGIGNPSPAGVLIGNNGLDNLSPRKYALYYSSGESDGNNQDRIIDADLVAGTRGTVSSGDRFTSQDPFVVPTEEGVQAGFSMAIQPSNQTAFGVHSPIRNGNSFRVNWTSMPFWQEDLEDEAEDRVQNERRKIAGTNADRRDDGMKGTGRGYSPKMGLLAFNGTNYRTLAEVSAKVGDTVVFGISRVSYVDKLNELNFDNQSGVTGDDLQSTANSGRSAADDQLIEGEIFQIGDSLWQVERRDGIYAPEGESDPSDSYVTLKCIEILTGTGPMEARRSTIGISGTKAYETFVTDEGGDTTGSPSDFARGWVGQLFYPLLKSDIALARSERTAAVTDIGIASTVFTQLSGLGNFPAMPTPEELKRFDNDNVQVAAGTQTLYTQRASFFTVHIRPSGINSTGGLYDWVPTGIKFGVVGNRPVEQFNFLRFLCTGSPADQLVENNFEFRLLGLASASMARDTEETEVLNILNSKSTEFHSLSNIESNGFTFTVSYRGSKTTYGEFFPLNEFINKGRKGEFGYRSRVVEGSQLDLGTLYPKWISSGKLAAYWYEIFGDPDSQRGETKTYTAKAYKEFEDGQPTITSPYVEFEVRATSNRVWWHEEKFRKDYAWTDYTWTVKGSSGDFYVNDAVFTQEDIPYVPFSSFPIDDRDRNPYTFDWPAPLDGSDTWNGGMELLVNEVSYDGEIIGEYEGRIFEKYSGVSEISFYDEVALSCDTSAEHRISYINQINKNPDGWANYNDLALIGLVLQSNRQFPSVDQLRAWMPYGVKCYRFLTEDYGPSNNFADLAYYLLTDDNAGAGTFVNNKLIDLEAFKETAKFIEKNNLFFDGVIAEKTNLRSFLSQLAPSMLCDFEIINGKFGIRPAIPNTAGTIAPEQLAVAGFFSAGNIIDDSFDVQFIPKNDRRDVRMSVIYREMAREQLPENRSVTVSWKDSDLNGLGLQLTEVDLSNFCTSYAHAVKVARYNLSVRRRIDHSISFKTLPTEFGLAPGNLIVVAVSQAPYSNYCNGVIDPDNGAVSSINPLADGTYEVKVYTVGFGTEDANITISNGVVTDQSLWGKLFAKVPTVEERRYYKVSRIELDEEGLVQVDALFFPTEDLKSRIAMDIIDGSLFAEVGG